MTGMNSMNIINLKVRTQWKDKGEALELEREKAHGNKPNFQAEIQHQHYNLANQM